MSDFFQDMTLKFVIKSRSPEIILKVTTLFINSSMILLTTIKTKLQVVIVKISYRLFDAYLNSEVPFFRSVDFFAHFYFSDSKVSMSFLFRILHSLSNSL